VKAVLLVPTFNNPNGSCMGVAKRRALLELLAARDLPLIEDDVYGDMHFGEERPKPVKAYDTDGRVLYCGSFSKSVSPALRVGWIAAGRYAERVKRLKLISTLATPSINQIAMARFLGSGALDRHLRALRRAFRAQVAQVSETVLETFPEGTAVSRPAGGFFLWVQLPEGVDALDVYRDAVAAGVHIAPGPIFSPAASIRNRIRLSCGYPCDERIRGGIRTLAEIVRRRQRQGVGAVMRRACRYP
jgi:DNA-binding transcriptional MocR family regulator